MQPKVVIIDDHTFTLDVMTDILTEEEKYDIYSYSILPDMNFLKKIQPDIILLDVMLQHHDGRTICKILRNDKTFFNTRIIMLSAFVDRKENFNEYGANAFIEKPFDIDVLINSVAREVAKGQCDILS